MKIYLQSLIAAIIFSILFYGQQLGLNILIIAILITVFLAFEKARRSFPLSYHFAHLFTAFMVFMEPSVLNIFIYFITFLILVGKSIAPKTAIYVSGLLGILNMLTASFSQWVDPNYVKEKPSKKYNAKFLLYGKGILISSLFVLLFVLLYNNANPIFQDLITRIDLSFIRIPWLLFTLLGFFIFKHILKPYAIKELINADLAIGNKLSVPKLPFNTFLLKKLSNEHTVGTMIFMTLNLVLIFFLITDFLYLLDPNITGNASYSKSVHNGIYALLFSIICAISLVLYFFRGNLNFFKENKNLRRLTYLWIGLNILLIIFTYYKNFVYVNALGLTYKRIGVFIYLMLTFIGLITTYWKVTQIRNIWYLWRTNALALFSLLVLCSAVPWDRFITHYNLNYIPSADLSYLIDLGDSNSTQLYQYLQQNPKFLSHQQQQDIRIKHNRYLKKADTLLWQEYTYAKLKASL